MLQFGYAERPLPLKVGDALAGYSALSRNSTGIHDDLCARVVCFRSGLEKLILCSVDVIGFSRDAIREVKQKVQQATGVPPERVLISATHTHSGPLIIDLFGTRLPRTPEFYAAIEQALIESTQNLIPVTLKNGTVEIRDAGFNRRDWDTHSAGVDWSAEILGIYSEAGVLLTLCFNFGCHCVVLGAENLQYSADWAFFSQQELKKSLNLQHAPIFFEGAAGNINPVIVPFSGGTARTFEDARRIGNRVAQHIIANMSTLKTMAVDAVQGGITQITLHPDDPDKLEDFTYVTAENVNGEKAVVTDLQVLKIGPMSIFAVPGELFGEYSIQLKTFSRPKPAWVVGYANDYIGYIPTKNAYRAGGYEALVMSLSENEGDQMLEHLKRLVSSLK